MDVQMQDATSGPSTSVLPQTTPSQMNLPLGTPKTSVTPSIPASAPVQIDAAKLEAIRKATLNSYKNKFLNLRDKFDKVNTTNTEYTATLSNAKKKEETIQDEINMLLDYLAQHGASDPDIARHLTRPPSLPTQLSESSGRGMGVNGS